VIEVNWRADEAAPDAAKLPPPPEVPARTLSFTRPAAAAAQRQTQAQTLQQPPAAGRPKTALENEVDFQVNTELPGLERMTQRDSERDWMERQRMEAQAKPGGARIIFPERLPVSREPFVVRQYPKMIENIEPSFVVHRRLLFEQPNFDRHGWELGPIQPGISATRFYYDLALMPYHTWTRPFQQWDSSAGKCLPGDNTPLFWYHEQFSVSGLVAQAGAVWVGMAMFP
jgi:hypothetical protein